MITPMRVVPCLTRLRSPHITREEDMIEFDDGSGHEEVLGSNA